LFQKEKQFQFNGNYVNGGNNGKGTYDAVERSSKLVAGVGKEEAFQFRSLNELLIQRVCFRQQFVKLVHFFRVIVFTSAPTEKKKKKKREHFSTPH
jgi:hypothetical protein